MIISREFSAALEYILRRACHARPKGKWDAARRWYPAQEERRPCCEKIRKPSRRWGSSLLRHCLTLAHCAELFGADKREANELAKLLATIPAEALCKARAGMAQDASAKDFVLGVLRRAYLLDEVSLAALKQLAARLAVEGVDWDGELALAALDGGDLR